MQKLDFLNPHFTEQTKNMQIYWHSNKNDTQLYRSYILRICETIVL